MRPSLLPAVLIAAAVLVAPPAAASAETVWLCRPGLERNPCTPGTATTRFSPGTQRLGVDRPRDPRRKRVDCFYVYPTVSDQPELQADRSIDPELRSIARYQAARYSRTCRVFAPVYRQITLAGLGRGSEVTTAMRESAYTDVRAAWREYLRHYNHGRGVVVIGHSQGTFVLRRLLAAEVDPRPAMRRRIVSAVLLGGNVTVAQDRGTGGDFQHLRACRSRAQVGCVVAFSAFSGPVPEDAVFGRSPEPGLEVLCTNPAALRGGGSLVEPILPRARFAPQTTIGKLVQTVGFPRPAASTPWLAFPGSYRARCSGAGGADVLQLTPVGAARALPPTPVAAWGVHLVDANIALGDLDRLVARQARSYRR